MVKNSPSVLAKMWFQLTERHAKDTERIAELERERDELAWIVETYVNEFGTSEIAKQALARRDKQVAAETLQRVRHLIAPGHLDMDASDAMNIMVREEYKLRREAKGGE